MHWTSHTFNKSRAERRGGGEGGFNNQRAESLACIGAFKHFNNQGGRGLACIGAVKHFNNQERRGQQGAGGRGAMESRMGRFNRHRSAAWGAGL